MHLRLNVAAILRNPSGRILICERLKQPGFWQFPQGGVGKMETLSEALYREIHEEIGVPPHHLRLLECKGPYFHTFSRPKKGYDGKEQHYFLCEYLGPETEINVHTDHPEFRDYRWIQPSEFLASWLPPIRLEIYRAVFRDFFDQTI